MKYIYKAIVPMSPSVSDPLGIKKLTFVSNLGGCEEISMGRLKWYESVAVWIIKRRAVCKLFRILLRLGRAQIAQVIQDISKALFTLRPNRIMKLPHRHRSQNFGYPIFVQHSVHLYRILAFAAFYQTPMVKAQKSLMLLDDGVTRAA